MNELSEYDMSRICGGDWVDIASGIVGVAVGVGLAATGFGAFASGAVGVIAADATKDVLNEVRNSPPYRPGMDDRYPPIITN